MSGQANTLGARRSGLERLLDVQPGANDESVCACVCRDPGKMAKIVQRQIKEWEGQPWSGVKYQGKREGV
jgi:hypothetical protein